MMLVCIVFAMPAPAQALPTVRITDMQWVPTPTTAFPNGHAHVRIDWPANTYGGSCGGTTPPGQGAPTSYSMGSVYGPLTGGVSIQSGGATYAYDDIGVDQRYTYTITITSAVQLKRQAERDRLDSLCGPATLAEVLRRREGTPFSPTLFRQRTDSLAKEMKVGRTGTNIASLVAIARQHGFATAEGVAVTVGGLIQLLSQKRPVIALLLDGGSAHFVLVEAIGQDGGVRFWDCNAAGRLSPGDRTLTQVQWARAAGEGYAIAL